MELLRFYSRRLSFRRLLRVAVLLGLLLSGILAGSILPADENANVKSVQAITK